MRELLCGKCKSDNLFFVLSGDFVNVACKDCGDIQTKLPITPELKIMLTERMQGNVPWKGEKE